MWRKFPPVLKPLRRTDSARATLRFWPSLRSGRRSRWAKTQSRRRSFGQIRLVYAILIALSHRQMKFSQVAIESIAYALPDEVWSSADVEAKLAPVYERLRLPQGRLELMTGIKERRFWPAGAGFSGSAKAGEAVLAKSSFKREEMDLLIHSAVCGIDWSRRLPPVHGLLGLSGGTQIFDVSNACLGFLNAMVVAASMIESGQIERALICSGENGRPLVENTLQQLQNRS